MIRRISALVTAALALVAVTESPADAACGPTYCPSYGIPVHSCPWRSGISATIGTTSRIA